jgi:hypothetical protein
VEKFNDVLGKPVAKPTSRGNLDVKRPPVDVIKVDQPSLGILQQFGLPSSSAKFISDNCLDLHGLDSLLYHLLEDNNLEAKAKVFKLMNEMLTCSNDPLVKEPETQAHLPIMYRAWAEERDLLPPPSEATAPSEVTAATENIQKRKKLSDEQEPTEESADKKQKTDDASVQSQRETTSSDQ